MNFNLFRILLYLLIFCSCTQKERNSSPVLDSYADYERKTNKEVYLDSLRNKVLQTPNDSLSREWLMQIAARYEGLKLDEKFFNTTRQAYQRAKAQKDTLHQAQAFWYLADYYDAQQIPDSAYSYYLKAEQGYASQKDSIHWGQMLLYKSRVLYNIGIYAESEAATAQALQLLSGQNDKRLLLEANILMTLILKETKDYDIALKYCSKIPVLLKKLEAEGYDKNRLQRSWLSYYNNIGSYYNEINQPEEAQSYFETALAHAEVDSFPKLKAMLLNNYARNRRMAHANPLLIDSLLKASLTLRERIGHSQGISASKLNIAEFALTQKDTTQALHLMKEVYAQAQKEKSGYEALESLKFLSEHDRANKDKYTVLYLHTQDSLRHAERQTRNSFARIAYETQEVERKNELLTQRNTYLWVILLVVSALSIAVWSAFQLRLRNKKLLHEQREQLALQHIQELLLKQQTLARETRNKERQRIAKDLHDAVVNRVFTTRLNLEELPTSQPEQKAKLLEQLQQTEAQIRTLAHDIHKNLFDPKQDYSDILEKLVCSQKNSFKTSFACTIDREIDWSAFSIRQKTQLYLILQELLHNVNKHAQAPKCWLLLLKKDRQLVIRIHDNGIGLDLSKLPKGMGFQSITHRLHVLHGELRVLPTKEFTTIELRIPLPENE